MQDAVDAIQVMDHMIDQMQQKIFDMTKLSDEMTEAGENASVIMAELESRNEDTTNAIYKVAEQIEKTNTLVQRNTGINAVNYTDCFTDQSSESECKH